MIICINISSSLALCLAHFSKRKTPQSIMYVYQGKITYADKFQDEAVAVVFPSTMTPGAPVLLLSQLSATDTATDRSFLADGLIKASDAPNTIAFSLSHPSGSIDLAATHSGDGKLLLRLGYSVFSEEMATLSLIYHTHDAQARIYTGVLDLEVSTGGKRHRAVKETLTAVSSRDPLGDEKLLCVLWQWTEVHVASKSIKISTNRKLNAHFSSPSYGTTTRVDEDFILSLRKRRDGQKQNEHTLVLEVRDTRANYEVTLIGLYTTVNIKNDTSQFVNFTVASNSTLLRDIISWVGLGLAACGVPVAVALGPVGATIFAVAGLAAAAGAPALSWHFPPPNKETYTAMPPQCSFTFDGYRALTVSIIRVKKDNTSFLVQSATVTGVGEGEFLMSSVKEDTWVDMIRVPDVVTDGKTVVSRGLIQLQGVRASYRGNDLADSNTNMDMGIYGYSADIPPKLQYNGSFLDVFDDLTVLESNENYSTYILFKAGKPDHGNYRIERLDSKKPELLLGIRYVRLELNGDEKTNLEDCSEELDISASDLYEKMQESIAGDTQIRFVYCLTTADKKVKGIKDEFTKGWSIKILPRVEANKNMYVFFRITRPVVLSATVANE